MEGAQLSSAVEDSARENWADQAVTRDQNVSLRVVGHVRQGILEPHCVNIRHHHIKAHVCEGEHQPNLLSPLQYNPDCLVTIPVVHSSLSVS